ncbi:MAG: putative glycoprotease [Frankiales bacterium]|nr:putative glycoprotease [Frankiales bacterium]
MLVLALDTGSPAVSVALVELHADDTAGDAGGTRWGRQADWSVVDGKRHGELLATGVRQVLAELGATPQDLTAVAVGVGPGPFTGLRVGITTGLVMADALEIPAYGACSLDAVDAWSDEPGRRLVVTDARRKEVYWAEYDEGDERVAGPSVMRPADLAEALRATQWEGRVVGDGALRYPEHFPGATGPSYPSADGLVLLAARRVVDRAPTEALTPLYLRRPDAVASASTKRVTP